MADRKSVYFIRKADPRLPAVAGEYLVHNPDSSIPWTALRPVHPPDPDALADPDLVTPVPWPPTEKAPDRDPEP